jgi:hypothetical protein
MEWCGLDWFGAQDRDKWRVLMNAVMNLWFHNMLGVSRVSANSVASPVMFSSVELISYTQSVGLLGRVISPLQGLYLHTGQTQNKHRYTSKPRVRFDPTMPVFQRVKTVQALD